MDSHPFNELPTGAWLIHQEELHIKAVVGPQNAVALTGRQRGNGTTIPPAQFVAALTPKEVRALETALTRIHGVEPPKFHPMFAPLDVGGPHFVGAAGFAYAFDALAAELALVRPDLRGEPLFTQLDALGLTDKLRRGRTPHPLPATLF